MLFIKTKKYTHQIVSCNIHEESGKFQLWVERPNGKSLKLVDSKNREDAEIVKSAIEHAIKTGDPMLELEV